MPREGLVFLFIVTLWFVLNVFVLPKLGIRT